MDDEQESRQEFHQKSRYEQERARMREMDDLVSALAAQTTDRGIAAEDTFKNAASSLFGWGLDGARSVLEESYPPYQDPMLHERIVETIAGISSSGQQLRRLTELQQIAAAFAHIGSRAREIASYAVEMGETVDRDLQAAFAPIYPLLFGLVQQAFVEIRGSIMISNARDTAKARRLLDEDSQMDLLYIRLQSTVQHAIEYNPLRSYLFQQALLVGARIKDIGDEVRTICHAVLHDQTI
jgi:hypothetical protein